MLVVLLDDLESHHISTSQKRSRTPHIYTKYLKHHMHCILLCSENVIFKQNCFVRVHSFKPGIKVSKFNLLCYIELLKLKTSIKVLMFILMQLTYNIYYTHTSMPGYPMTIISLYCIHMLRKYNLT